MLRRGIAACEPSLSVSEIQAKSCVELGDFRCIFEKSWGGEIREASQSVREKSWGGKKVGVEKSVEKSVKKSVRSRLGGQRCNATEGAF